MRPPYPNHSKVNISICRQTNYLIPNRPCIIGASMTAMWPCRSNWVIHPSPSHPEISPNWKYLVSVYGDQEVTVADCNTREFSDQQRRNMVLREAVHAIEEASCLLETNGSASSFYVKDWHLVLQSRHLSEPDDRQPYNTPRLFMDDCTYLDPRLLYHMVRYSVPFERAQFFGYTRGRLSFLLCWCERIIHTTPSRRV